MKAPFTYYGGKQRIGSRIAGLFPPHKVYIEPFCGGAGVFWRKQVPAPSNADDYREVLNDTNGAVVTVFRWLRNNPGDLARAVRLLPYSDREFRRARDVYAGRSNLEGLEYAALMFLFFCASYSGKATGGLKRSKTSENPAATWARKPNRIPDWAQRLLGVYVEDVDYRACFSRWDSSDSLFYVDPPYVGANQGHYGGWSAKDQVSLVALLSGLKGAFVLSGYGDSTTNRAAEERGWKRHEIKTTCSANRTTRTGRSEIVWTGGAEC